MNEFALPILLPAYPEIWLLVMASTILVVDLFLPERSRRSVVYWLSLATLAGCAVLTIVAAQATGGQSAYTFGDMFVADLMAHTLKLLSYLAVAACFVYSRRYLADRDMLRGEYFVLALFALLGMMVMISANHLLVLYLGLELMSLCLYSMVALNRDSAVSTEAAMKYFILGALASGLLLYGMSMLYGATGHARHRADRADDRRRQGEQGQCSCSASSSSSPASRSSSAWCRSTCGFPTCIDGAPNAMTLFIGSAPEARGVRDGDAAARERTDRSRGRLAADAGDHVGAVDGDRQLRGHRADEHQAHARVFDHLAHGLHAARAARGRGRRQPAVGARRLQRGDVLRDRLRADEPRRLRHGARCCRAPASRPRRSPTSRGSTSARRGTRSSCCS